MRHTATALAVLAGLLTGSSTLAQEPAGMPDNIAKELDDLVGSWRAQGTIGDAETVGTYACRWATGKDGRKCCLIGRFSYKTGDKIRTGANIIGWDAAKKCIEDRGFDSDGGCATLRWTAKSPTEWRGEVTMVEDGEEVRAKAELTKKGPTEILYEARRDSGEAIRIVYTKVTKERKGRGSDRTK